MEEYSQEIVDNIKHEQEVHFFCYLPGDSETDGEPEVKEVKIVLRKFDKTWKSSPELFKSYFVCGKCEYASKTSSDLNKHLKTCKPLKKCERCLLKSKSEKIIDCIYCDQQFKCNNCKSIHISQVHRKDSTWLCCKCDYSTLNKECLRQHYRIHVKKFSCQTCHHTFSHIQCLKNHQKNNRHGDCATGQDIQFECRSCIHSFATKDGLRQHEKYVHSKIRFHCEVCGKTMKTKSHFRIHIQTHQKVPCPICHHLLAERRLQSHIEKHTTTARFKCDSCKKAFFDLYDLNNHKSRIHEIEQVQCDLCQKFFKNKLLLRNHMQHHLKISCPTCSGTMSKNSISQHMKIHSSKRESLSCAIVKCRQKFSNIKELKDHKQIHIGTQIYKCPNCNYQSKKLLDMKKHLKCHQA